MEEIWKDIEGLEGIYQVSNLGRVKSLKRYVKNKNGLRVVNELILTSCFSKTCKYLSVFIGETKKDRKSILVHRIVATAFVENPNNLNVVNHKNSDIFDNRPENLEWCTTQQNVNHSLLKGRKRKKLNEEDIFYIKKLHDFINQKEIAKIFNITQGMVSSIKRGDTWKHL